MLLVDFPFVSDFLREAIERYELPLVMTESARALGFKDRNYTIDEREAVEIGRMNRDVRVYTCSENAIDWVNLNLSETHVAEMVGLFKDKHGFREKMWFLHPEFYFTKVGLDELDGVDLNTVRWPVIVKPNVGFFSLGVHRVESADAWAGTVKKIQAEVESIKAIYPTRVLDTTMFVIESCIEGEEYAIDAYFNEDGEPVILSILHHRFADAGDTGDRLYVTSKKVMEENLERFGVYLKKMGELTGARNMPIHVEVRVSVWGEVVPIEVNPLRFGAWCSTGDLSHCAFGHDPYVCFFEKRAPDWEAILNECDGADYNMVVLDNTTGYERGAIKGFDYERFVGEFSDGIDLRKADINRYGIFGFFFVKSTDETQVEIERVLHDDLRGYVTI